MLVKKGAWNNIKCVNSATSVYECIVYVFVNIREAVILNNIPVGGGNLHEMAVHISVTHRCSYNLHYPHTSFLLGNKKNQLFHPVFYSISFLTILQ